MTETAELRASEAVPLAHALVARLAELEGIRILFVKGPTAVALGARPPRPSTDVDVLCEPGGMQFLGTALEACGWRRRIGKSNVHELEHGAKYLFEHSLHYIHDEWPCDIDVHYNFPGFLAPDEVVFEALWARRATVDVAHTPVQCPDVIGQVAIVGLHAFREPLAAVSKTDLEFLAQSLRRARTTTIEALAALTVDTGCSQTLRPLLEHVGAPATQSPFEDGEGLNRWRTRTESAGTYTTSWVIEMSHAPWQRKAVLLRRDLFPPMDIVFSRHVGVPKTPVNVVRLYACRWWTALRSLSAGIRAARKVEREVP